MTELYSVIFKMLLHVAKKGIIPLTISCTSGREINFFSDSHLAPKFFKVVANSKKVGRHFQRQTKSFFTLSAF